MHQIVFDERSRGSAGVRVPVLCRPRTGRQPAAITTAADPSACPSPATFSMAGGGWNGWSIDRRNWRFQPDPGVTTAQIRRLKVKWAFSYGGGNYGQPTLAGGRLFLTSRGGAVYSLDAKTGCLYWRFAQILVPLSLARRRSSKTGSTCQCRRTKRESHHLPAPPAVHSGAA